MAELRTVFVTLSCIAAGTALAWCCAMPDGHYRNILLFWQGSTAALVFRVGACFEVSLFCTPLFPIPNTVIGLLASVDVKQQNLSLSLFPNFQRPSKTVWTVLPAWLLCLFPLASLPGVVGVTAPLLADTEKGTPNMSITHTIQYTLLAPHSLLVHFRVKVLRRKEKKKKK